jgi:hypothetical protein
MCDIFLFHALVLLLSHPPTSDPHTGELLVL